MDDILKTVQSSYDNLAPAQRAVAEFIVDHYQEIPFLSVTAMAKKIQVSDTTIIKYCMEIGFSGFGDFKKQITERVKSESDWLSRMEQNLTSLGDRDGYETVYKVATENLKSTINNPMNRQNYEKLLNQLDRAADILLRAGRICICGLGNSHAIAADIQHKLMRLGLNANAYSDNHLQVICSTFLKEGDALWTRFRMQSKAALAWYYKGIRDVLEERFSGIPAFEEYCRLIDKNFGPGPAHTEWMKNERI